MKSPLTELAEKKEQDNEFVNLIDKWERKYNADMDATNAIRWEWYKNVAFVQGDQWKYFNKVSKKLVDLPKRDKREIRLTVNIIWYMLRAIRGFTLRYKPLHEVEPVGTDEVNIDIAKRTSRLLDWNWIAGDLNKRTSDCVFNASWASIGILLMQWNHEERRVRYVPINPLNVWWDTYAGDNDKSFEHLGYSFETTEEEVRNNPEYDMVEKDENLFRSEEDDARESIMELFERRVLKENKDGARNSESSKRLKGREVFYYKYNKDEKSGEVDREVWVLTWLKGMKKPLRHKKYDAPFIPLAILHADRLPGKFYGTGLVKHAIPAQMAINRLESLRLSYISMAGKYRLLIPKTAGLKEIHDMNGTRLEYATTTPYNRPQQLPMSSMPFDVQGQLNDMQAHIQKIMGVFDQFLGQPGFAGESGRHAESMQAASANNQAEFQLNLENFLADVGYVTLWFYEKYLDTPMLFTSQADDGDDEYLEAIGSDNYKKYKGKPNKDEEKDLGKASVIPIIQSKVRVKIGSQLAYTEGARFDRAISLFDAGILDDQAVLEILGFGNIGTILSRKEERDKQRAKENPVPEGMPPVAGQPTDNTQMVEPPIPNAVQAQPQQSSAISPEEEVALLLSGDIPESFENGTPNAPIEHTMGHVQLIAQSQEVQALPDEIMVILVQHIVSEAERNGAIEMPEIQALLQTATS